MIRLQKLIADAGICSRRKAENLIEEGRVSLNGKIARLGQSADLEKDDVRVDGESLKPEKKIYLVLNKPKGFVTTVDDPWGRRTVRDLIHLHQRVFPVGRLDKDTTGLLLMTNDGDFANRVMHPRYEVPRVYEAELDKKFDSFDEVKNGIFLDRKEIQLSVKKLAGKRVRVTVHTGMHKEIKRIFKSLGYWVRELSRVQLGDLKLDVKPGKFRHLVPSEIQKFLR